MKWLITIAKAFLESKKFEVKSETQLKMDKEQSDKKKAATEVPAAIELLKSKGYIVYAKTAAQTKKSK